MKASLCKTIFEESIDDYHRIDDIDETIKNPYPEENIEHLLYLKAWIDTIQWHLEDLIRDPEIDPRAGMRLKQRIDYSNQYRTDVVEKIDDWFLVLFKNVTLLPQAGINTESPAWVLDRLSILCLKIYHIREQVGRKDVSNTHRETHSEKLQILLEQQQDLMKSFDILIDELTKGNKIMKVYRQMKLYNNPETNPVIYKKNKPE